MKPITPGRHCTIHHYYSRVTQRAPYCKPEAVKLLEKLMIEAKGKKYPSIPFDYLAPIKYRDDTANGLTRCIIDFLRLNNHQAERISNTGRRIDNRVKFCDVIGKERVIGTTGWISGTGTNGTADISCTIGGRSVKIEVKIGNDKQSLNQLKYEQSIIQSGGLYIIATSFMQFCNWYYNTCLKLLPTATFDVNEK